MDSYLSALKMVREHGHPKENRTGVTALTVPHLMVQHSFTKGFPLLTTKKMPIKIVATELLGFLNGITNKKWYQDRGCHIWDEWSNPTSEDQNDLGPIYGYQWRRFCQTYDRRNWPPPSTGFKLHAQPGSGADQLGRIIHTLKTNPYDRRMVCSAWSPLQLDQMALPPCHLVWHVTVIGEQLNLCWFQRSCDMFLGVPFNIASYAMLMLALCRETGFVPGILTGFLSDAHIYENHITQVDIQLRRKPKDLPNFAFLDWNGILNWKPEILDYNCYNALKGEVAV